MALRSAVLVRALLGAVVPGAGAVALAVSVPGAVWAARQPLKRVATIQLPRADQGFCDYLVVDPEGQRLYAGYSSADALVVIDMRTSAIVGSIGRLRHVRSVALVPELGLGFTSDGGEGRIGVVRLDSLALVKKIAAGRTPDAILFDRAAGLVYCSDHEGRAGILVDPRSQSVVASIPLGGTAEYAVADPQSGTIYQNLEDESQIAVIDPAARRLVRRFALDPGQGPTGLALDAERRRLFAACSNEKLVVIDAEDGHVVAVFAVGGDVDFVAYDPGLQRVYVPSGEGWVTVVQQEDADRYRILAQISTRPSAARLGLDPSTHRVYVVADAGDHAEILVYDAVP